MSHFIFQKRYEKKTENTIGKRCYKFCLYILVLFDVILLTGIIVAAYHMCSERYPELSPDTALCLPCKDIRVHPDDFIEDMLLRGDNNETCCMKDTDNYDGVMN